MQRHLLQTALAASLLLPLWSAAHAQSVDDLNRRLTVVERKLSSDTLIEMVNELTRLRQAVDKLRGDVDGLDRRMADIEERQRQMYADLDERLRTLEEAPRGNAGRNTAEGQGDEPGFSPGRSDNSAPMGGGTDGGGSNTNPSGNSAGDESPDQLYQRAFETLRAGNYEEARGEFKEYLKRYPDERYADNARYWLGESYYVVRDFDQAMDQFQSVLDDFPDSPKRADAMLKIGYIQYERGQLDTSRKTLNQLLRQYPNSTAADRAEQRMERISQ